MAENLIYGKTVLDFGAVGDGKNDDTDTFVKAFDSGESLICIPYGHYTVKKELNIKSGVKIHAHPRAVIDFVGITAEEKSYKTVISGGVWNNTHDENCAFDFTESVFCTIENAKISTKSDCAVGICGGKNVSLENLEITSAKDGSGLVLGGDISFARLKDISFSGGDNAIELVSGCCAYALNADGIVLDGCKNGICGNNFSLSNSFIYNISGESSENTLCFDCGEISDTVIKNISVYDGYIYACGTKFISLDILNFRRLTEKEASPLKASFTAKECPDCSLICDGIPLDAVILSKKSVPDVKITAAKLAAVSPSVYNYTLELPLDTKHTYIIPCGGFDSLNLFSQKD